MTTTVPPQPSIPIVTLDISNDPNKPRFMQFHLVDVSAHDIRCKVTASEGTILDTIELRVLTFFYPLIGKVWGIDEDRLDKLVHFHGVGRPKFRDAVSDPLAGIRFLQRGSVILPVESDGVYTVDWLLEEDDEAPPGPGVVIPPTPIVSPPRVRPPAQPTAEPPELPIDEDEG